MFQCKECKGEAFINKLGQTYLIRTCIDCGYEFSSLDDSDNLKPKPVAPKAKAKIKTKVK